MTITKRVEKGRTVPTKIGACGRCGRWYNEAGILELPRRDAGNDGPQRTN
jgi:hypothetical protein